MAGRKWLPDPSGTYILDFGDIKGHAVDDGIIIRNNLTGLHRKLDVPLLDINPHNTKFFAYSKQFLLMHLPSPRGLIDRPWKNGECWPFFIVSAESFEFAGGCIPYGPWAGKTNHAYLTRIGLIFLACCDQNDRGIYLLKENDAKRIVSGVARGVVVSPDGCKAAISFSEKIPPLHEKLMVLDLCKDVQRK